MFDLLAKLGVICLLFRIGLDSDLAGLIRQVRRAMFIWAASVAVNGAAGFTVFFMGIGLSLDPSAMLASLRLGVVLVAVAMGVMFLAG